MKTLFGVLLSICIYPICGAAVGEQKDICALPLDQGPCAGGPQRWYFNMLLGTCEEFAYSGCGGNANNFESLAECLDACGSGIAPRAPSRPMRPVVPGTRNEICTLPFDQGPCAGGPQRWYFDVERGVCRVFAYSGCGGNANRFRNRRECEQACLFS